MSQIDSIIFDLGGVLIDWNPEYVFLEAFKGDREKMRWFLENICTSDWNENQDAGYPLDQATEDLIKKLSEHFTIHYNSGLTLITIKNFTPEALEKYKPSGNILLEQHTLANYMAVIKE